MIDADGTVRTPQGRAERTLLLLLALNGHCVHVEQAQEVLWPGLSVDDGRDRLRKLLCRLPSQIGRLVFREGDTLVLLAQTHLAEFEWALATIVTYGGQQRAPEARCEEWAEPAHRRLRMAAI